jgi:peptide/nickel transport system permease protein/oligopeptide transport system permease protein
LGRYVAKRALYTLLVIIVASWVIFAALRVAPGTPADTLYNPHASLQAKQALITQLGLNRPLVAQYLTFLGNVLRGNLGESLQSGQPIPRLLVTYGGNSLVLIAAACVLMYGFGIPLGVLSAVRRDSPVDHLLRAFASISLGIPNFLLGLLLVLVIGSTLGWLPISGTGGLDHLILPTIALGAEGMALTLRLVRSSVLEQLGQDYVRTLRAKGLMPIQVWTHALRNALLPLISLSALQVGSLVGYTAIVEVVFRWPGLGQLLVNSVLLRDYPLALMLSLVLTVSVALANFVANVGYAVADPRIRLAVPKAA